MSADETRPIEQWFVAVLVFESHVAEDPTYDESMVDVQYRLVRAVDADSAYERALALGRREQVAYENIEGETCEWRFAGLEDLQAVNDDELGHGVELYGFIENGIAADRVVPKDELTEFRGRSAPE